MRPIKTKIDYLKKNFDSLLLIHYASAESEKPLEDRITRRITSIAVLHVSSSTMHSFSMHLEAEIKHIPPSKIADHYDELELSLLENFYDFVNQNKTRNWVHWKMSNIVFGFEAIAHRYRVLSGKIAPTIEDEKRFNLATLILQTYGENCINHPIMYNVLERNGQLSARILKGDEEVRAFKDMEHSKLQESTMSKVYSFRNILVFLFEGKLKVQNPNFGKRINDFMEKPVAKVMGFTAVIIAIVQFIYQIYKYINLTN